MTLLLQPACDARAQSPKLAAVNSIDEAVVIGAALSLSSSAFVLQLMAERNELGTRFGSATLGILLFQARPRSPWLHVRPSAAHCPGWSPCVSMSAQKRGACGGSTRSLCG